MKAEYLYDRGGGKETAGSSGRFSGGAFPKPPSPRSLPPDERPRERLIKSGPSVLSDRELLSIILVSGIHGRNVSALAEELLDALDRGKELPSVEELLKIAGLGESKACVVAAMMEFGRRKWAVGKRIRSPVGIFDLIRHYADRRQERFICVSLNGAHEVLAVRVITVGLVNRTIVHPREVFADPITDRASAVVVAHNHPSGDTEPSADDDVITCRLEAAANVLGLTFLDHLVFSENSWFSYRQNGLIIPSDEKPAKKC